MKLIVGLFGEFSETSQNLLMFTLKTVIKLLTKFFSGFYDTLSVWLNTEQEIQNEEGKYLANLLTHDIIS